HRPGFAAPNGMSAASVRDHIEVISRDALTDFYVNGSRSSKGSIPPNFKLTKDTLFVLKEIEEDVIERPICSHLEVVALTRDARGGEWGRLLRFRDPDGVEKEWSMPAEMLSGDGNEYRAHLLGLGLSIWPGKDAKYGLHEYLLQCRPPARVRAVV